MPFWQFENQTFTPIADDALLRNMIEANAQAGRKTAIGLIGSGGKTTLLHLLAHQAADKGFLTFAGTTTHLAFEEAFLTSFADAQKVLLERQQISAHDATKAPIFAAALKPRQGDERRADIHFSEKNAENTPSEKNTEKDPREFKPEIFTSGSPAMRGHCPHKLSTFSSEENAELYRLSELSLWEADGSKRLPLKVPRDTEPCLESWFSDLVLIVGLAAAGQPLGQICHCFELLQQSCPDLSAETPVDAKVLAEVLRSGYLMRADLFGSDLCGSIKGKATEKPRRVHLLFNHCDTADELQLAEATAAFLPAEAFSGLYAASLKPVISF